MHGRAVEAQRQVHKVHSLVQDIQAAVMPLAVASAAAAPAAARRGPALRTPGQPGGAGQQPGPAAAGAPERLHRGFSSVFAGLAQLAALFAGDDQSACSAASNPAPLLLTAPDGSSKTVRWQEQDENAASHPSISTAARPAACDREKEQLRAEVQRLCGELAAAQARHAAVAAAAASAASGASSSSSQVQAAIRQLEAVVPTYKAAAGALQGQVGVLKEKLAAACRERTALQQEVGRWREAATKHEAAFAAAAAKLHAHDARSLAANSEASARSERLHGDVEALRRRCGELAGRLREALAEVAQLQSAVATKDKLAATQGATIRQLESTIAEQQVGWDRVGWSGMRWGGEGGTCMSMPLLELQWRQPQEKCDGGTAWELPGAGLGRGVASWRWPPGRLPRA